MAHVSGVVKEWQERVIGIASEDEATALLPKAESMVEEARKALEEEAQLRRGRDIDEGLVEDVLISLETLNHLRALKRIGT